MPLLKVQDAMSQALGLGLAKDQLSLAQVLLRAAVVYLAGVAIVRIASKRLMGSHTPFDFILAVILGSMLARAVNGGAPLLGTLAACLLLVFIDRAMAFVTSRSERFRRAIEGEHLHVVRDGSILRDRLRRHHLTEEHVWAAIRSAGLGDPREVEDAYMEVNGRITVLPRRPRGAARRGEPRGNGLSG